MVRIYLTLCALGTVSLLALIFGPTLVNIATVCWRDDDYSHGLILPFAALYILWTKKEIIGLICSPVFSVASFSSADSSSS